MEYFSCCSSYKECIKKEKCIKQDFYNTEEFNCVLRNRLNKKEIIRLVQKSKPTQIKLF